MIHLGLAIKALTLHHVGQRMEHKLEPYFVAYVGTEASIRDGRPLVTVSRVLSGVERERRLEFDGFGLLVFPPLEVGRIAAWHIELWDSDDASRSAGMVVDRARKSVNFDSPIVRSLTSLDPRAYLATQALFAFADRIGAMLRANGDDRMTEWAGSAPVEELERIASRPVIRSNGRATVEFRLILTDGPEETSPVR